LTIKFQTNVSVITHDYRLGVSLAANAARDTPFILS